MNNVRSALIAAATMLLLLGAMPAAQGLMGSASGPVGIHVYADHDLGGCLSQYAWAPDHYSFVFLCVGDNLHVEVDHVEGADIDESTDLYYSREDCVTSTSGPWDCTYRWGYGTIQPGDFQMDPLMRSASLSTEMIGYPDDGPCAVEVQWTATDSPRATSGLFHSSDPNGGFTANVSGGTALVADAPEVQGSICGAALPLDDATWRTGSLWRLLTGTATAWVTP